jgi:hypothetical protein
MDTQTLVIFALVAALGLVTVVAVNVMPHPPPLPIANAVTSTVAAIPTITIYR